MVIYDFLLSISYEVWIPSLIAVLILDRWVFRAGTVKLVEIGEVKYSDEFAMIGLEYNSNQRFIKSTLTYTVRDTNDPTTVINGKARSLDFSKKGMNNEFLLIKKNLLKSGDWVVDVKVSTTSSRINFFHSIFPIETHIQKQVEIKL